MLLKVFKITTSILLILLFSYIIAKRDFMLSVKDYLYKKNPTMSEAVTSSVKQIKKDAHLVSTPKIQNPFQPATVTEVKTAVKEVTKVSEGATYIAMKEGPSDTDESYRPPISPCKVTMGYKIGRLDSNFGLSQFEFIAKIDEASQLWGDQAGKKLFQYNPNGPLTINLIYDERQARTNDVNLIAQEIDNTKQTAESLKAIYEQEKAIYLGDGEQLTKDNESFQARYKVYNDKVTKYNAEGGAPKAEYEAMTQELASLKAEVAALELRRVALVSYMTTINEKVKRYNELVVHVNNLITKSNSLGAKKFTEGRFVPYTNTVDIYQYNDTLKLKRVLAHELGHVLGINHNENAESIMYSVNTGNSFVLTNDDIDALRTTCAKN